MCPDACENIHRIASNRSEVVMREVEGRNHSGLRNEKKTVNNDFKGIYITINVFFLTTQLQE